MLKRLLWVFALLLTMLCMFMLASCNVLDDDDESVIVVSNEAGAAEKTFVITGVSILESSTNTYRVNMLDMSIGRDDTYSFTLDPGIYRVSVNVTERASTDLDSATKSYSTSAKHLDKEDMLFAVFDGSTVYWEE